jgi:hypothetical protein
MTRPARFRRESFVAFRDAENFDHCERLFAPFRLDLSRLRPVFHEAGASLPHEFNALSLRLAITRLASPNGLNNCAAFLANPLYRVLR